MILCGHIKQRDSLFTLWLIFPLDLCYNWKMELIYGKTDKVDGGVDGCVKQHIISSSSK